MAAAVHPKIPEFSPEVDEWQVYREQLEQYFEANSIGDETKKKAVILSSIGPQTYKLLRDLSFPKLSKEKSYDQLCEFLNSHYGIQVSVWKERQKFYSLHQEDGMSIAEWYAKVRSVATSCQFGENLTSILRDKFTTGIIKKKISDRLFEEDEKATVEKNVETVCKSETAGNLNFVEQSHQDDRNRNTNQLTPGFRGDGQRQRLRSNSQPRQRPRTTRQVEQDGGRISKQNRYKEKEKDEELFYFENNENVANNRNRYSSVPRNNHNSFVCNVKIENRVMEVLIDSGSLIKDSTILRAYDGSAFSPLGYFIAKVTFKEVTAPVKFYVVDGGGRSLLGRDWLAMEEWPIDNEEIRNATKEDLELQQIKKYILRDSWPSKHAVTGESPAKLMLNRTLRNRLTLLSEMMVNDAERCEKSKKERQGQLSDYRGRRREFQVGEEVMVRDYRSVNKKSWIDARVIKRIGKNTYLCKITEGEIWKRHANQMQSSGNGGVFLGGTDAESERDCSKYSIVGIQTPESQCENDNAALPRQDSPVSLGPTLSPTPSVFVDGSGESDALSSVASSMQSTGKGKNEKVLFDENQTLANHRETERDEAPSKDSPVNKGGHSKPSRKRSFPSKFRDYYLEGELSD
ncbi:hypothetical protein NQ315_002885 [Exocentrus adspersus]|uniref:Retrotransposon gag domain-containing protein n=1 Tax=Exocentrus adspersus TaxID=1586481 RepID=A0AAV8VFG3_9CUCU|nr:hypothetical protein NQ315_002885 [Exocentrus adspersus]